jgi:hypothetical protein
MSTALLQPPTQVPTGRDRPLRPVVGPRLRVVRDVSAADPLVLYGDFNCPWSYLAFRRAGVLSGAGLAVDWRAVEHAPRHPRHGADPKGGFDGLHEEMDRVVARLLPEEELPYDLAGFVPRTRAAVASYAEGYAAHVAGPVRRVLFEAFWMHGIDIGDARVLRTLLVDELRSGTSPSATVRDWGYGVDVTGGPISTAAWRLAREWATEWAREWGEATRAVPLLIVPGRRPYVGLDAVDWLAEQITARDLDPQPPAESVPTQSLRRDLPSLGWVSEQGGQWLRRCEKRQERW